MTQSRDTIIILISDAVKMQYLAKSCISGWSTGRNSLCKYYILGVASTSKLNEQTKDGTFIVRYIEIFSAPRHVYSARVYARCVHSSFYDIYSSRSVYAPVLLRTEA